MRLRKEQFQGALLVMAALLVGGLLLSGAVAENAEEGAPEAPPRSPGGSIPLPRAPLLTEDSRLIDIEGLVLDLKDDLGVGAVNRAAFQPRDGLGYFILLENALLEKTLAETSHGERPVKVRGTVTVFQGRNYLLLDYAAVKRE